MDPNRQLGYSQPQQNQQINQNQQFVAQSVYQPPIQPNYLPPRQEVPKKKENGWVKFLRVVVWFVSIVLIMIGVVLYGSSTAPEAYIDGSYSALLENATVFLWVGVILLALNVIWGVVRWVLRWRREKWKAGRVIGKLIGGGIWRTLAIGAVAFLVLWFVAPMVADAVTNNVIFADAQITENSTTKVETAFREGRLNANEYVNFLIDAAYDDRALPEEYQSGNLTMVPDILDAVNNNLESLDLETTKNVLTVLSLSNVDFGADASGNADTKNNVGSFFATDVYAATSVTTLNKVVKSTNGEFLIFYTDAGDNKISDEAANNLATMMERITRNYESKLGLKYHTEQITYEPGMYNSKRLAMEAVLNENGIDSKLLNSAMPIYVVNPYSNDSNTLATYAGRKWAETLTNLVSHLGALLGDAEVKDVMKFYLSSPVLPFINILPENIDNASLELVAAHEIGHHYASNYCYDTFGAKCKSEENFVDETLPNYMASVVVENQPKGNLLASHLNGYIKQTGMAVYAPEQYYGYAPFGFLENYVEVVPDGKIKVLNVLMQKDAYWYLYEQAGKDLMAKVLSTLAVKNITNDYENRYSLYASKLPKGEALPCYDLCAVDYDTGENLFVSSSIHYYYFPVGEFIGKMVEIEDKGGDYGFDILGEKDGRWSKLGVAREGNSYQIKFEDYSDYKIIAVAVSDHSESDAAGEGFTMKVSGEKIGTDIFEFSGNCVSAYTDNLFGMTQGMMSNFYGFDSDMDAAIDEFNAGVGEVRNEIGNKKITICNQAMLSSVGFENVYNSLGRNIYLTIWDHNDFGVHMRMAVDVDPTKSLVKTYTLTDDGTNITLTTMIVE